ncbi:DNA topoisomerase [Furfurilactobacillus entadae]|uniref:DNA topoisomerase n=1 Tax=Furfurilactobacillus entadae TaxID=2922307 RepID=UPI0035E4F34C
MDYLILAEKPSAAKHFAAALGGRSGSFDGHSYEITAAHGHLMELDQPENLVTPNLAAKYHEWNLETVPWTIADFTWGRTYKQSTNPHTGKKQSSKSTIDQIRKLATQAQAIVIATDNDPSGEGELLAWEIINAIDWHGQVLRAFFDDEFKTAFTKAMGQLIDVTDQAHDGDYVKADVRNKWDWLSMQLTRVSTLAARNAGYNVRVAPQGRLKSVMVSLIYQRLQAIKQYVRKPYYEARFHDQYDNVFKRKLTEATLMQAQHEQASAAQADVDQLHATTVQVLKKTAKQQIPPPLLDLAKLAGKLGQQFSAKQVQDTYQAMYDADYMSYPRTEDHVVTPDQFAELVEHRDAIAQLVGVDPSQLTHLEPRKTHVGKGSHGANRPGSKLPQSLAELDQFGPAAQAIYTVAARSALAMLAENYQYMAIDLGLQDFPDYQATLKKPVALGFKTVLGDEIKPVKVGKTAQPFVYEGANKKPAAPTTSWLFGYLEKHQVGTGATHLSTMSNISTGTGALVKETKGKLSLTQTGQVTAVIAKGTMIASTTVTKQLFDGMAAVGQFEKDPDAVLNTVTQVTVHDKPIMLANASALREELGQPTGDLARKPVVKTAGTTAQGQQVKFNRTWAGHRFTDAEVDKLLAGDQISFTYTTKAGKEKTATGDLQKQTYKQHEFWGFKSNK